MNKNKSLILIALAIFTVCFSLGSVSAADNSTDNLNAIDGANSVDTLNAPEEADSLSQIDNSDDVNQLAISESSSSEILALSTNSSDNVLSSSVSVSSGHTFHKNGYTFKVSDYQYKKIKEAIKAGKKGKFLDWGFEFTVKTNKVVKVKVLVKKQTVYKKVRYEGLTKYPYRTIKLAYLKNYYNNGWKKYAQGYESVSHRSSKYNGFNYVKLKKTVKTYKTVKMRVYAIISYQGVYDYDGEGPQYYYPGVDLEARKTGYPIKDFMGFLLKSY